MEQMKAAALLSSILFLVSSVRLDARIWTDATTGRTVEAELVKADATSVTIRTPDRREFVLPLLRLAQQDRDFVAKSLAVTPLPPAASTPVVGTARDRWEPLPSLEKKSIPVSGKGHRRLEALDEAVLDLMVAEGIPAMSFSVMKNGKLVHERAYGWGDADLKTPHQPGTAMRLASMTKPITAALIHVLEKKNKLRLKDKVYVLLGLDKAPVPGMDPRWKDITVQHLLDHMGGWDRDTGPEKDFTVDFPGMARACGVKVGQLTSEHMLKWGLDKPLQFDPGTRKSYSNYGYSVLGSLAEKVTGQSYEELVVEHVGKKCGMTSLRMSHPDLANCKPGEIWHFFPKGFEPVEEGVMGYRLDAKPAAAALACTASDYCSFVQEFQFDGTPRKSGVFVFNGHGGRQPGVSCLSEELPSGITYTFITNRMEEMEGSWSTDFTKKVRAILDGAAGSL